LLAPYGVPLTFNPLLNRLTFIYLNLNRARTEGFELSGNVALTSTVRVQSSYTYLSGVDRATGLLLPQRHRHQGFVKAEYSQQRWGMLANIRGVFFSKWPINPAAGTYGYGYRIWDLYGSKHLRRGFQAFGSIDNLADSTDRKLDAGTPGFDRPDYGRTFRLGLRYSFSRENN
jgi:outer membrane receptor for ferrienterochelin and colicins